MITLAEFLHKYLVLILWILWIVCGALYYHFHDEYEFYVALYKSVSIGWSIGWDMPYETDISDLPASMTYSCFHNCMGVMFTGMAIIMIAEKVVVDTDDWMVEITRKNRIKDKKKKTPGLKGTIIAFLRLNKTFVELVVVCFLFGFCGVMLGVSLGKNTWTIRKSMDFTLSTLCTCGYLGLPSHALSWKYVVLSIYTNCGVPFLNIGLGALITMFIVNPNEMELHKKISAPLTSAEIQYMKSFGIDDGDGFISRKEYTMLTIIRIGRVNAEVVQQIRKQFKFLLMFHGQKKLLSYEHLQRVSNKSFHSISRIFPLHNNEESFMAAGEDSRDNDVGSDDDLGVPGKLIIIDESSSSLEAKEDKLAIDGDGEDEVDDDEDDFPSEHQSTALARKKMTTKARTLKHKISDASFRNLKHTASTKNHLKKVMKHNEMILKRKSSSFNFSGFDFEFIKLHFHRLLGNHQFFVIIAWVLWLVLAGVFYSVKMNVSFMKGFYSSVNIGYSIYWTTDESDPVEKAFSVVHLLVGQVFMSVLMAVVATNLIISKSVWYGEKQMQEQLKRQRLDDSLPELILHQMQYWCTKYKATLLFLFWLVLGATWSCCTVRWPVIQGVYFSITSLSMGGIWPIPENSEDSSFFFVAVYTAFGAPILLLNASIVAEYIAHLGSSYLVKNVVYQAVTPKEIQYMQRVGMEDGSGQLDEQEYVLLTLIRLRALPHEIVSTIVEMFNILDHDNLGNIPYAQIINHKLTEVSPTPQNEESDGMNNSNVNSSKSSGKSNNIDEINLDKCEDGMAGEIAADDDKG